MACHVLFVETSAGPRLAGVYATHSEAAEYLDTMKVAGRVQATRLGQLCPPPCGGPEGWQKLWESGVDFPKMPPTDVAAVQRLWEAVISCRMSFARRGFPLAPDVPGRDQGGRSWVCHRNGDILLAFRNVGTHAVNALLEVGDLPTARIRLEAGADTLPFGDNCIPMACLTFGDVKLQFDHPHDGTAVEAVFSFQPFVRPPLFSNHWRTGNVLYAFGEASHYAHHGVHYHELPPRRVPVPMPSETGGATGGGSTCTAAHSTPCARPTGAS